jgi:HEAT repeat protein
MQHRLPSLVSLIAVAAAAVAFIVWYRPASPVQTAAPQVGLVTPTRLEPRTTPKSVNNVMPASPPTAETVSQWIAETQSGDAAKRATAIAALAEAPKAQALPVLRHLLTDADPQIDRPLALRSLRDLALSQGDADGAVRDAVRNAIYHGDDQTKKDDVQEVLDIIEESERR